MRGWDMPLGVPELGARLYRPAKDDGCQNPICRRHWERREQAEIYLKSVEYIGYEADNSPAVAAVARLIVAGYAR